MNESTSSHHHRIRLMWLFSLVGILLMLGAIITLLYLRNSVRYVGKYIIGPNVSCLVLVEGQKTRRILINPEHAKNAREYSEVFWGSNREKGITCEYRATFKGEVLPSPSNGQKENYDGLLRVSQIEQLLLIRELPSDGRPQGLTVRSTPAALRPRTQP